MDGTPLYREISNSILHEIETGTYSENVAIPAERALCRMYHASRSTVRRALEVLQSDGYIVKAHGNGNYVKPRTYEQKLTKFHSFAGSLKAQHILLKNVIVDYELTDTDKYLESLHLPAWPRFSRQRWHKLVRLR